MIPDLDDIIEDGLTLTQALAFWSEYMNTPVNQRGMWRDELELWKMRLPLAGAPKTNYSHRQ